MMTNKTIEQGYKNYKSGDPISDEQLSLMIKDISKTVEGLSNLNDRRFDLVENKLRLDLYSLEGMAKARNEK